MLCEMEDKKEIRNELHKNHRARVKNNVAENGFAQLEDHRFLELLLFYSVPRVDTNETAHLLLNKFGSLEGVVNAEINALTTVKGVGKETAIFLKTCGELCSRIQMQRLSNQNICASKEDTVRFAKTLFTGAREERSYIICFDESMHYVGHALVSKGDVFSTACDMRAITDHALNFKSSVVMLTHIHPCGEALPSVADADATRSVAVHLRKIGILLADHLIFGGLDNKCYSMRDDNRFSGFFY